MSSDQPYTADSHLVPVQIPSSEVESVDEVARRALPWATLTMLVIIVIVFVAMVRVGHGDLSRAGRLFGDKEPSLIRMGQWWRLITPIFLHGSWPHLIMNGLSLLWFGGQMERIYGWRKYLLIFIFAGIAGNILSYLQLPAPSLGASGALFGLIGAGIVFPIRFRHLLQPRVRDAILRQLALVALINLGLSFMAGIDRYAHFGGFLGGAFVALFLVPDVLDERPQSAIRKAVLNGAVVLMIGLVAMAGMRQWNEARQELHPELITYACGDDSSAYRLQLSTRWRLAPRQAGVDFTWIGPHGATIKIVDSQTDTDLYERIEQRQFELGVVGTSVIVGGQPGTLYTFNTGGAVTESCEILAANRAIEVVLVCSGRSYSIVRNDYAALLESLTFPHPSSAVHPSAPPGDVRAPISISGSHRLAPILPLQSVHSLHPSRPSLSGSGADY